MTAVPTDEAPARPRLAERLARVAAGTSLREVAAMAAMHWGARVFTSKADKANEAVEAARLETEELERRAAAARAELEEAVTVTTFDPAAIQEIGLLRSEAAQLHERIRALVVESEGWKARALTAERERDELLEAPPKRLVDPNRTQPDAYWKNEGQGDDAGG